MRGIFFFLLSIAAAIGPELADSETVTGTLSPVEHDRAIALARAGDYAGALAILADLRAAMPDDAVLLYDETVVLAWAGDDAGAIGSASQIDMTDAPDYVLDAVAKAHRNTGHHSEAVAWYTALLDRNLQNLDARLGLAFSHADAGDVAAARAILEETPGAEQSVTQLGLAQAYLFEREGRYVDALARYQSVLELEPANPAALRGLALVLRELLLPQKALALAREHPGILDTAEIAQLDADVAALAIREGSEVRYPAERRFEGTDRALARLDALLARPDLDADVRRRLEYDRIVALTDRRRTADAIAAFEALDEPLGELPVYLLDSTAAAYLDEHRPSEARKLLEHAISRAPDDLELKFRLFFAFSDSQAYDRADALAESLLAEIAATRPASDPTYLRARILAGLSRAYADRLGEAQVYFESLAAEVPHNTEVRQELANVYRWRGWVERSLGQYGQVLAVEPEFLAARVGEAHSLLDAREFDAAGRTLTELESRYPTEPAVRNLARRWQSHNMTEVRIDARFGESSGTTFGEDQYTLDASWYSRPLDNRYRLLLRTHDAVAEFPEGDAHHRRAGLGVDYRYARWQATAVITADRSDGAAGIDLAAGYRYDDRLTLSAGLETESTATPLRGYRTGVSSTLASLGARYARDEATSIGLALSTQALSDDNRARSLLIDGARRIVNRPRLKIAAIAELYASSRDRDDVAYFSPRHDRSWLAGFRGNRPTYRRHRLDLAQELTLTAGRYDQAGFAAGGIWAADYRLSLAVGRRWYSDIGVRRARGFYDGTAEHSTWFVAGFGGRF